MAACFFLSLFITAFLFFQQQQQQQTTSLSTIFLPALLVLIESNKTKIVVVFYKKEKFADKRRNLEKMKEKVRNKWFCGILIMNIYHHFCHYRLATSFFSFFFLSLFFAHNRTHTHRVCRGNQLCYCSSVQFSAVQCSSVQWQLCLFYLHRR